MSAAVPVLRVERGHLTDEEAAALTIALLVMTGHAASRVAEGPRAHRARWRRLERSVAFRPGHSWQLAR